MDRIAEIAEKVAGGLTITREGAIIGARGKLEAAINSALGHKPRLRLVRSDDRLMVFEEKGLEGDVGIMGLTIKSLSMDVTFQKKELSDGSLGGSVHLDWTHRSGGTNGATIANIWFTKDDRFKVQSNAR